MPAKYIDEYRDRDISKAILQKIETLSRKKIRLMEVCGTHTMSIFKSGIRTMLPDTISLLSGPGCPVCVTTQQEIDMFIELSGREDVIVATFGDLIRVPGSESSLQKEKAGGSDIRIVYSTMDALQIAKKNPDKSVVFLGIGFETTAPTVAASLLSAKQMGISNYFVFSAHKLVPPALTALVGNKDVHVDGFILPGHVSVIIGERAYRSIALNYHVPCVIAGFEPTDILQAIFQLITQIGNGNAKVENAYPRAVTVNGNETAQRILSQVFKVTDASWRGIGIMILPHFDNPILTQLNDSAVFEVEGKKFAFTTDSYVVDPIFFPGGDIGSLAVNGTVNDLAMCGAKPLYLSVSFIIEEGFSMADLHKIIASMKSSAQAAGVLIVTGDTKVVQRKAADKIFINTSGLGILAGDIHISGANARPGDQIIISGFIADHGITILTQREGLTLESPLRSDTAPLNQLVQEMMAACGSIHTLRDPTRGGVATTLNEIAVQSGTGIKLYEAKIPIRDEVRGACELLGLDPLYIANEGKLLACVSPEDAAGLLQVVQANKLGRNAAIIGEITTDSPGNVFMETTIGGSRIIDMLTGEPLPRIC